MVDKSRIMRRANAFCLRCRLIGGVCTGKGVRCTACKDANVKCLIFPPTENDVLFGLPTTRRKNTNIGNKTGQKHHDVDWRLLNCSSEFLREHPNDSIRGPEDVNEVIKNPHRDRIEKRKLPGLLGPSLKDAIVDFRAKGLQKEDKKLPLPSSELLRCIALSIAKSEANKAPAEGLDGQNIFLSEHMSGSSLLALGVLLQEYSNHLL
ncbi:hypothetical protein EV177_002149 [Coemansia sp. RSA 1804]|nr:hypothetical protein EV177_002149 [Coemansia sp. RSA 1804]